MHWRQPPTAAGRRFELQPTEPGLNHFNGNPNSSAVGLSAQFKAGFRVKLTDRMFLFTEYRYL